MNVGLSTTSLEVAMAGGVFDGIAHYTKHLGESLPGFGVNVTNYAFDARLRRGGHQLAISQPIAGGLGLLSGLGMVSGGQLKLFAPDVEVFHSTDFKVVPTRCPVVATIWDAIPILHPEWLSPRIRTFAPFVLKRAAHFADRIICSSEHAAGDAVRYFGLRASDIAVVPWGIAAEWFDPVPPATVAATLKKYQLEPGYVLTVGTLQPRKNIGRLVDAWLALPRNVRNDHKLVVVGRDAWGTEELAPRLRELEQKGAISWLRDVGSDEEMRHLYRGAHVFVLPSLYEGFGIPLLEAFAVGVPVVSANVTALPEVSAGAALEIDPLDVPAMTAAILTLCTSEAERTRARDAGLRRARELSVDRAIARTVEVYDALAASRRPRRG